MPAALGPEDHRVVAPAWTALEISPDEFVDTFVFPVSHRMGLPPGEVARLIRASIRELAGWRPRIALWVPVVDAPAGDWFRRAVHEEFWGAVEIPYAVTDGRRPRLRDFSYPPARSHLPAPALEAEPPRILEYPPREQQVLLTLRRLRTATTAEIAAHVGCSDRHALRLLASLEEDDCIEHTVQEKTGYEAWTITRRGVLIARRGWGIPPGKQFRGGHERSRGTGRHRRTARLWPAWLREAYPDAEVWAGWSEPRGVGTGRHQPDALAWGRYRDRETIFWLEVESGNRSREELRRGIIARLRETMSKYADYQLVYTTLAVPWAGRAVLPALAGKKLPPHVAVVIEDWKNAGVLPRPRFGSVVVGRNVKKK